MEKHTSQYDPETVFLVTVGNDGDVFIATRDVGADADPENHGATILLGPEDVEWLRGALDRVTESQATKPACAQCGRVDEHNSWCPVPDWSGQDETTLNKQT